MKEVVIQIPTFEDEQNIEIDVRINGKKRRLKYRVEIISWEEGEDSTEAKVDVLKQVIKEHDKDWKLIQIGVPSENRIPVMFMEKHKAAETNENE
ncbi:MAG: hypothetical protein GTO45_10600 [Candidatus Aminicenantes bacterium]|nr:hypothetical protein [Candidatus Aminicenantes bacterium]NIM79257.1 hypothetical protein [Candidatus Aminicenantes bacterium]NIN18543.1 hypothetical protein [Candidatus Aminicenantes bacterium]NIN42440.1 hypothetical protein [Candidatus Aminicenantes bacterium]NIN85198.1 hypothetical protein [Candidatus Aminicenantes bacterium]